jgi:hypothetical protein
MTEMKSQFPSPGKTFLLVMLTLTILIGPVACKPEVSPTTVNIVNMTDLLRILRAAGAVVEPSQEEPIIPSLPGEMLQVDGETIQVGDLQGDLPRARAQLAGSGPDTEGTARPLTWMGSGWYAVYDGRDGGLILLLSGLLGDPIRSTPISVEEPFPPAVPGAMRALAKALGREPQEIVVLGYQTVIWPDACLGIPKPGEICAQAETPGWLIQVSLDEKVYALHSDETGGVVAWNEPQPDP